MTSPTPPAIGRRLAALLISAAALACSPARAADAPDYSPAEVLLFMSKQLGPLTLPATLRYSFRKSGTLEAAFDDQVTLAVSAQADGKCCVGRSEFLSGARRLAMPEVEGEAGNPVLVNFLERDVREMQRLTQGSQVYFRKRIRMAIYNAAKMREVTLSYRGREIRGQEVLIAPYADDPGRGRYEKLSRKVYRFLMSDAVPGGVFGIRSRVDAETAGAAPLIVEELWLEGAVAPKNDS